MRTKLNEIPAYELAGLIMDLMSKIRKEVISIQELKKFLTMKSSDRKKFFGIKSNEPVKTSHLIEIYHEEEIFIDGCGGDIESGLHCASNLFTGYLSSNLKDWNLINPQQKTEKAKVKIFEIRKDGNYMTLFKSFNIDLEKLCMTQSQIRIFCQNQKEKLRTDGYGTFFLFKEGNVFFVAYVYFGEGGRLRLNVRKFRYDCVWCASYRHRLVVPATALIQSEI